jgi:hypothetical protein
MWQHLFNCLVIVQLVLLVTTVVAATSSAATSGVVGKQGRLDDIEFVYQVPDSEVQGLVVLFHGCSHSATDWWPKSSSCPHCIGLPVELSIVRYGLERGFAMVAVSSRNRNHKCWSSDDVSRLEKLLPHMYRDILHTNERRIPLHLLGASSGGKFASLFSIRNPRVSSVNVQIMSPVMAGIENSPPTLFTLMAKDEHTRRAVSQAVPLMKVAQVVVVEEQALNALYFWKHSTGSCSKEDSTTIYQALLRYGVLHKESKMLIEDPRQSPWRIVSDF